ncbi:hypothetical protein BDR04DRAFT_1088767, partial [Suillus decipiens]
MFSIDWNKRKTITSLNMRNRHQHQRSFRAARKWCACILSIIVTIQWASGKSTDGRAGVSDPQEVGRRKTCGITSARFPTAYSGVIHLNEFSIIAPA